jgi:serine/threonine protein kinase
LQPSPDIAPSGPFGRQDPTLPQVFGRYLLVQRLSRGGMGEIFLAKHGLAGFEKLAVIKKVLPHLAADAQFISRFVDEAQVAIKLSHVNVAQVFEVGRVGDEYFLALEYIDGRDLRRTLARLGHYHQRLPVDLALFIARELANGLAYAHRRTTSDGASLDLVHCDISPPNVLVSFEGETKVIDFGIAKSAMRETATDPKVGFGKFGYMAPEQLLRGGVVDYRTDIYAAGVVLFELLTGTRLYEAGPEPDYRGLARKVSRGEHQLPSEVDPVLAPYDDLVATALQPKAADRYQSAAELRDAIQQCLATVNPTISTDQLGSYMRELFADEMHAQRELHERVASAHLSDFQAQFHTQTISTVSFALAQLPLQPPDATGRVIRERQSTQPPTVRNHSTGPQVALTRTTGRHAAAARATGRHPVTSRTTTGPQATTSRPSGSISGRHSAASKPSPALDTMAPPTGALDRIDASASARRRRGAAERTAAVARRYRGLVIAGSAVIALVVGVGLWGFTTSDGAARPPAVVPQSTIAVEPIPMAAHATEPPPARPPVAVVVDDPEIEMTPDDSSAAGDGAAKGSAAPVHRPVPEVSHRPVHREPRPAPVVPPAAFTRELLGQKYQQVRREYDAYKAKFGSRLEREWGELATTIQYMPASDDDTGRKEAARKLDVFRARMRE